MGSTSLTMELLLLSLCLALASAKPGRDYKHTWGANGTVPKSFINLGAINIQGVGSMNVISQSFTTRSSPMTLMSVLLAVNAMLLCTGSTCLAMMEVVTQILQSGESTTVMPTLSMETGAPSTTPLRVTLPQ